MNEKIYYSAEDIAKMLGVSMGKSYKILREMNKELAGKGFLKELKDEIREYISTLYRPKPGTRLFAGRTKSFFEHAVKK